MNQQRRKALADIAGRIEALRPHLEALGELGDLISELEGVKDEEQEAFEALPESLQQGERGQGMETAVSALEGAQNSLQELADAIEASNLDDIAQAINEAQE